MPGCEANRCGSSISRRANVRTCEATHCATSPAASMWLPSVARVAMAAGPAAGGDTGDCGWAAMGGGREGG